MATYFSVTGKSYRIAAELVYRLMAYPMDYMRFATLARNENEGSEGASTSKVTNDMNVEFIHKNIHCWVGRYGPNFYLLLST
ncbi:hypothetical protein GGR53DRAFT_493416 [Hypoxylon sp. FL1150]|nr:hypothetical protein GGR53DRAFT_493416 [Hypoxylon sp. FL1150]